MSKSQDNFNKAFGEPRGRTVDEALSRLGFVETPGSSNILGYAFVESAVTPTGIEGDLYVKFKSGTYVYYKVPASVVAEFAKAESKGSFLASKIKGRFEYKKVA